MTDYISNINITMYNPDGTTWTQATQDTNLGNNTWRALAYDGTKFVALGSQGYISTSIDGINWTTAVQNTNLGNNTWRALAYDGTKFVALGYYSYISTSIDGINWTTAVQNTNLSSAVWNSLVYDGTKFVALGLSGYISTSTDGVTWTQATQDINLGSNDWQSLAYNGTKFVALGRYGDISISTDGTTWTTAIQNINLGNNNWTTLTYDGVRFIALSTKPIGDTGSYISYSTDGTTWTQAIQNENLKNGNWHGLVHNNRRAVALDINGMIAISPDTVLTQQIPIGGTNFDGQWVGKYSQLSTAKATGTYNLDLSTYLPDDNYNYEVYLYAHVYSINSTYTNIYARSSIFNSTFGSDSGIEIACVGTNGRQGLINTIIPIGTDRILTLIIENRTLDNNYTGFCLAGYRRIGTNS